MSAMPSLPTALAQYAWHRVPMPSLPHARGNILGLLSSLMILILLGRILYTVILYPEFLTPLKAIPTPRGRSFLNGTIAPPSATTRSACFRYWMATVPNNGVIRYYQDGNQERLLVTSAQALGEVLVSKAADFAKPESVRLRLSYVTGNGLLLAEGDEHKTQRRSLLPAFSFRHIKDLYPIFWDKGRELVKCLEYELGKENRLSGSEVIEVREWTHRTTLDIIGLAGMRHNFNALQDPENPVVRRYQQMRANDVRPESRFGMLISLTLGRTAAMKVLFALPTKQKKWIVAASSYIRDLCKILIHSAHTEPEQHASNASSKIDIISVAQRSGTFTNENLVDQMMTFLAAGHGTTSHALQWAVYALCKNHDIQTRLRKEIRSKLPSLANADSTISATSVDSLAYLHAFCNEVLRLYPPIPTTVREAVRNTTVAGYHIPKGTTIILSPRVTNSDPELWGPIAEKFDPERWLEADGTANNTGGVKSIYGFLTFLHGPRNCIGAAFARAELACLVAALVGRFSIRLEDPDKELVVTRRGIGSAPVDGVRVRLEVIDGW